MGRKFLAATMLLMAAVMQVESLNDARIFFLSVNIDAAAIFNSIYKLSFNSHHFIVAEAPQVRDGNITSLRARQSGRPFSSMVENRINYRDDDAVALRRNLSSQPDLYARQELCHLWSFEALDELRNLNDRSTLMIGYTQTGTCVHEKTTGRSVFVSPCADSNNMNMFHIISMVVDTGNGFLELIDEVGSIAQMTVAPRQDSECAAKWLNFRSMGVYDLSLIHI